MATTAATAVPAVPSVARAIGLLDRLAERRRPMSLAQLASELALPKSSVHGLCATLLQHGYLHRAQGGAFTIGPRVLGLAEAFVAGSDAASEFNALWAAAGGAPEETVVLSMLSGTDVLYVATRNGARPLGLAFNVGMRLPAHLTGSGKAMLAACPPAALRALYADGLPPRLTKKGPRDLDALVAELATARRRGWAVDDEGVREGVYSFGAAVHGPGRQVVAGIAVCINKALLGVDRGARHREAALDVARRLSLRLGGGGGSSEPGGRDGGGKAAIEPRAATPAPRAVAAAHVVSRNTKAHP